METKINKKAVAIAILLGVLLIGTLLFIFIFKGSNKSSKNNLSLLSFNDLKEDTFIVDDYKNNVLYENTIYYPKEMVRIADDAKVARYRYGKVGNSYTINYGSCLDDECINIFKNGEKFERDGKYYVYRSTYTLNAYFKNSDGIYITLQILTNGENDSLKENTIYKKLFKKIGTKKINRNKYYVQPKNGFYEGNIEYTDYVDENEKASYVIGYKVDANKYGSIYNKNTKSNSLYLDKTRMSFYEGEITSDLNSVKQQTLIQLFVLKDQDFNLEESAILSLELALNQDAFEGVSSDNVNITTDSLFNNDKNIEYYKIVSYNNNSHGERLVGYYRINSGYYYVIQIYGGEGKELYPEMLLDFLPVSVTNGKI